MRIRIEGTDFPGTSCGPSPQRPDGHANIHVGVQRRGKPAELLGLLGEAGADVVGVDWRVPLDEAARRVGASLAGPSPGEPSPGEPSLGEHGKALQGNLDPAVLLAGWDVVEPRARAILARARTLGGHVFNLGHGVLPETDPDILARLTDLVHEVSAAPA